MIQYNIQEIKERYNADNDCSPDYPTVNWTDIKLLEIIEELQDEIEELESKINRLVDSMPAESRREYHNY